jgi:hypothetical protein
MSLIERRLERAIQEGEEVLHGQLGEPPNEEAWADLADLVIGDLADDYRGAVRAIERSHTILANAVARDSWSRGAAINAESILRHALRAVARVTGEGQ